MSDVLPSGPKETPDFDLASWNARDPLVIWSSELDLLMTTANPGDVCRARAKALVLTANAIVANQEKRAEQSPTMHLTAATLYSAAAQFETAAAIRELANNGRR